LLSGSRRHFYLWLAIAVLAVVPMAYTLPLVGLGLDDPAAVLHFSAEERLFYDFHGRYGEGPLYAPAFNQTNVYPKAFYNLAGLILYPYSAVADDNFRVVLTTWRALNMVASMAAGVLLFFIGRSVFRSSTVAFAGALLFAVTPDFLEWAASMRPNSLETLFIFASLLFAVRLVQRFSYRTFLLAATFAALSFATKYGGWSFVGLLPGLAVYLIWREGRPDVGPQIVRAQVRLFNASVPVIGVALLAVAGGLAWVLSTYGWDPVAMVLGVSGGAFRSETLARAPEYLERWRWLVELVTFGALASAAVAMAALFWLRRSTARWMENATRSRGLYAFLFLWLAAQVSVLFVVTFAAAGPVYVARPDFAVAQIGFAVYYTLLGGSYGPAGALSFMENLAKFAPQFHIGWIGFALVLGYAGFREIRRRADARPERVFLWLFCGVSVAIIGVSGNLQIRHVLPAIGILYLFAADAIVPSLQRVSRVDAKSLRLLGPTTALAALVAFAALNVDEARAEWQDKRGKPGDIGLAIGEWMLDRYPTDTRIMTDWWTFYVPPRFENTATTAPEGRPEIRLPREEWVAMVRDSIVEFDPDVMVVSHPTGYESFVNVVPLLASDEILASRDYRVAARFRYGDTEPSLYQYEEILIYEKPDVGTR